jgi:hypothetical protein
MATRFSEAQFDSRSDSRNGESTVGLLRRLMDELATLFRQEVALATAEVTDAIRQLTAGVISIVSGGAILFAGFLVLLAAAVLGLSNVVEPWLAALIVGGVVAVIGVIMVIVGRKAVDPSTLKPRRSAESLRQDKEVLTRSAS